MKQPLEDAKQAAREIIAHAIIPPNLDVKMVGNIVEIGYKTTNLRRKVDLEASDAIENLKEKMIKHRCLLRW